MYIPYFQALSNKVLCALAFPLKRISAALNPSFALIRQYFDILAPSEKVKSNTIKKSAKSKVIIDPVQGTRDFPPEEMRVRNYVFDVFRSTAKEFCFEEYDAPVLEHEALYVRKGGEEITKQMYNFSTQHGHRVSLRPEMTPSLARLIMAKGKALALPAKWFSIPQCWRYEDITRGRRREHYQWNMDIIGVKSIAGEAELIASICTALKKLGLTENDVVVKINSRKILQEILRFAGVKDDDFVRVCIIVDKFDKLSREEILSMLAEIGIGEETICKIFEAFCETDLPGINRLLDKYSSTQSEVCDGLSAVSEIKDLFEIIKAYGFEKWVTFDASIVRGLSYYTGIVFEVSDREKRFRAICGGGRYDKLFTTYGASQDLPACGFGFGDCVILEILRDKKLLPSLHRGIDDVVIPFDESMRVAAIQVLSKLRSKGRNADIIMHTKKVAQCFAYADNRGADRVVFVAPDEWRENMVRVKYLRKDVQNSKILSDKGENISVDEL